MHTTLKTALAMALLLLSVAAHAAPQTCSAQRELCLKTCFTEGRWSRETCGTMCSEARRECMASGCWQGPRTKSCGFSRS